MTLGVTHHHKHIFLDGIINSDKLELTNDMCDPTAIWFVLLTQVEMKEWEELGMQIESCDGSNFGQQIILVDWSDYGEDLDQGALSRLFFVCSLYFLARIEFVTLHDSMWMGEM